jgi:hypothetical protein
MILMDRTLLYVAIVIGILLFLNEAVLNAIGFDYIVAIVIGLFLGLFVGLKRLQGFIAHASIFITALCSFFVCTFFWAIYNGFNTTVQTTTPKWILLPLFGLFAALVFLAIYGLLSALGFILGLICIRAYAKFILRPKT